MRYASRQIYCWPGSPFGLICRRRWLKAVGRRQTKMAPENRGHCSTLAGAGNRRWIRLGAELPYFKGSEAEARHVAIADGDAAAFSQQAVDRSHQAGEQGGGRQEADRCSLGHGVSPFLGAEPFRFLICN